jgi:hypothetical protein
MILLAQMLIVLLAQVLMVLLAQMFMVLLAQMFMVLLAQMLMVLLAQMFMVLLAQNASNVYKSKNVPMLSFLIHLLNASSENLLFQFLCWHGTHVS